MRSLLCVLGAVGWAVFPAVGPAAAAAGPPSSFTIEDPRITESSGLAASRSHPGVYWTHNDSEDGPYVYAVDSESGRTVATVTLSGVEPRDVEAISAGPGGRIYVADIGDNLGGGWSEVWIYRFQEPEELRNTTLTPVRYTVRYEGGPRDAESLMVHPKTGRVYIVSKNEDGGGLYEGPRELSPTGVNTFRRTAGIGLWATDAAFSPDGSRLVVRSYFSAAEYRWAAGSGKPEKLGRPSLPMQRQGESVTFTPDGRALMYGTEGARSRVSRVSLSGKLLPDSVAEAKEDKQSSGPADGTGSADGTDGADGADSAAGGGGDGESERNRNLAVGALACAGVAALVMGLRRLLRRD